MKTVRRYSLHSRPDKVQVSQFAKTVPGGSSMTEFIKSLPGFLAAADFKELLVRMRTSRKKKKPILFACGAHIIKTGLSPVFIDLMREGWISGLALNGAGIIHDFEVAFCGRTSEEVESQIRTGRFGMARETGDELNRAIHEAAVDGRGLGESVGRMLSRSRFPYKGLSLCATAFDLGIPVTVHVALGTDIIHSHPGTNGEALGGASLRDFQIFCRLVEGLDGGGVFVTVGSAVILPEVFLKAVSAARNRGFKLETFTSAVFDFQKLYRPDQNVVRRPLGKKSRGFYFVGHHEIMIPLLAAALKGRP
jgi:hypothetical protein